MTSIIKRLTSFTPLDDLSDEFESPYPLATCIECVDTFEKQSFDADGSKNRPFIFSIMIQEKAMQPNDAYVANFGAYRSYAKGYIVASLDLTLVPNGDRTTVRYNCGINSGLKIKSYINLIIFVVFLLLTIQGEALAVFGVLSVITAYAMFREWAELKNVKEGLTTLVELSLQQPPNK